MKRVLICEDDEAVASVIKIILEGNGFETILLSSGKGILKKIKQYLPSLILLDIWMPGIDGLEVTTILKRDELTKKIPIVIISALQKNEINKIIQKTGADGYLAKPFSINALLGIVRKYAG